MVTVLGWLLAATLTATAAPPDPQGLDTLPALSARAEAAALRQAAAKRFFEGEVGLDGLGAVLGVSDPFDPASVDAGLRRLDAQGAARVTERFAAPPDSLDPAVQPGWREARERALAAEDAADAEVRRALYALASALERAPGLSSRAVTAARGPLDRAYDLLVSAGDPGVDRLDEARLRWSLAVDACRRAALGGPKLDDAPERALLLSGEVGLLGDDAAARWALLRSCVADRAGVDEAIGAWLAGPRAAYRAPAPEDDAARAVAEAEIDARLRGLVAGDPLTPAWTAVWEGERAALRSQIVSDRAAAAAEAARRAQQQAAADPSGHPARAELDRSLAWTASGWNAAAVFSEALRQRSAERAERVASVTARADRALEAAALPLPPADVESVDAVYADLRTLIEAIRAAVRAGPSEVPAELTLRSDRPDEAQIAAWHGEGEEVERLALRLTEALAAERAPGQEASAVADAEFAALLLDLRAAKGLRHRLRPAIGTESRRRDNEGFLVDARVELGMLPPQLDAIVHERSRELGEAGRSLLDWDWWTALLRRTVGGMLLIAAWAAARPRSEAMARSVLRGVARLTGSEPVVGLERPVERVVRPLIDGGAWWLLAGPASAIAPELGVFAETMVVVCELRAIGAMVRVAVAGPHEARPALFDVSAASNLRLDRSLRFLGTWWVVRWLVDRVFGGLFYADSFAALVRIGVDGLGAVGVAVMLATWEPAVSGRVRRLVGLPGWVQRVVDGHHFALAPVRSLVGAGWLGAAGAWDLVQGRAVLGASTLLAAVDRLQLAQATSDDAGSAPIDPALREALVARATAASTVERRPVAESALLGHVQGWQRERRRGLIVLTGDRGDGKQVFLRQLLPTLVLNGQPAQVVGLAERTTDVTALRAWLASAVGLEGEFADDDALVEALRALPPRVIVVRNAQRSLLRVVGGFAALRSMLYVLNATGGTHLWVLMVHRPTWAMLSRMPGVVPVAGAVRGVVDLEPMSAAALRRVVLARASDVGITPDFSSLVYRGPFGASVEVEQERAVASYFRLLAEAVGGCPDAALRRFADSLRQSPDGRVHVEVPADLFASLPDDLTHDDLFALVALRIHDRLRVAELAAVTDAPIDAARAVLRSLEQRALVEVEAHGVRIMTDRVAPVTRLLRRRHLLAWRV